MSRIDEIWEAYYKGKAAAEDEDVLGMAVHQGFGHVMATMLPGGDSDEEKAFEKGYHGEELDLCYECEHISENCECSSESSSKESRYEYNGGSDYDDRGNSSSGSGSGYSDYGSGYSGGGGGGGGSTGSGGLPLGVVLGGVAGGLFGIIYSGGQIANIRDPNDVSLGLQCGIPILAIIVGALGLGIVGEILKKLASPKSSFGSNSGRIFLIGFISFVVVLVVGYQLAYNSIWGWSWTSLSSGFYSDGKPETSGTPFESRHWKIQPFTKNNNRTAPLLWSYAISIPANTQKCQGSEKNLWVEPNTVVFVRLVDSPSGEVKIGTPNDRRTIRNTSSWMAARFFPSGKKQHPGDFEIKKRESFVVCEATHNMVLELEARRLP
jgi:hypothetical protein